jgi:hypothetical protein
MAPATPSKSGTPISPADDVRKRKPRFDIQNLLRKPGLVPFSNSHEANNIRFRDGGDAIEPSPGLASV